MGSSGEANTPAINPAVGGLVWVRRRNGSWWPGKIVGLDELTEDCLVSPRSGTPVKLLGREDASVDWYNLERSKRVKAFRCGDYDKCIEKAKAAATANKRSVKYARREDAILHALELETPRQSNGLTEICSKLDNVVCDEDDSPPRASPIMLNFSERSTDSQDTLTSAHELSQSGISFEESTHEISPKTPNESEDDEPDGIKRMRGLEDLGPNVVKVQTDVGNEPEQDKEIFVDGKDTIPVLKRKRSQVSHVHEFLKRKCRLRTITNVLESTCNTLVSVPIMYLQIDSLSASLLRGALGNEYSVLECHESKMLKENGISSTLGIPKMEFLDSLFDVPFVDEYDIYPAGFSSILAPPSGKLGAYDNVSEEMERSTSKWQSKRKRNSRHTNKTIKPDPRSLKGPDDEANGDMAGLKHIVGTPIESELLVISKPDRDDTSNGVLRVSQHMPKTEPDSKKPDGDDTSTGVVHATQHSLNTEPNAKKPDMDSTSNGDQHLSQHLSHAVPDSKNTLDSSISNHHSRFSVDTKDQTEDLYDVVLEVKSDYQPQHVPLVSLVSKFNSKAIIGHPLTVEAMKEGTSYQVVKGSSSVSRKRKSGYGVKSKKTRRPSPKSKKSSLLLKKTRKLSALTGCQILKDAKSIPLVEKIHARTVIACIPLQVVFSRLKEAVSGTSRSSQRVPASSVS